MLDKNAQMFNSFFAQVENCIRRIHLAEAEIENEHGDDHDPNSSVNIDIGLNPTSQVCSHLYRDNDPASLDEIDSCHYQQMSTCSITMEDFQHFLTTLTTCQKNALLHVKNHYGAQNDSKLHLFITGGAGVGKSFLLKLIVGYLQLYTWTLSGCSPVKTCAPTGTAARHVSGQTIHSLLNIPVDKYLNYASLTAFQLSRLRQSFSGVHTLVIDEISMVSDRMLTIISRRLSEIAGNDQPFGGYNMILFGDFFQIKPVLGKFAFQNRVLWELFYPLFLRENVRRHSDQSYIQLLNRARVGMLTTDDIKLLKTRLVLPETTYSKPGLCIYPTRSSVYTHNALCQQEICSEKIVIQAEHFFSSSDAQAGLPYPSEFIPDDDRIAGNIPCSLELSVGSRVMLLRNIEVTSGLVNGALGFVNTIQRDTNGIAQEIIVSFDNDYNSLSTTARNLTVSITKIEHKFVYAGRSIVRRNFPLSLSWACTIHKVQGITTDHCSVDLGSSVFQAGMAYVALSRVTNIDGLNLIRFDPNIVVADDSVLEEYNRLRELLHHV